MCWASSDGSRANEEGLRGGGRGDQSAIGQATGRGSDCTIGEEDWASDGGGEWVPQLRRGS